MRANQGKKISLIHGFSLATEFARDLMLVRCKRLKEMGSDYCWQHRRLYEARKP